jgi:diguanylate cyclase (GGDEF)-like protein/PAS domain S-box-containing protein
VTVRKKTRKEPAKDLLRLSRKVARLEAQIEERALSEERYRSLVESIQDSIYLVDHNCQYLFVNKKHRARLGLPKKSIYGKTYDELHSGKDTKAFTEKVEKVFKTGKSLQYEHKNEDDDKYFLLTLSPVRGKHRKIISVTVVSKDITRLKHLSEKLRTLSLTDDLTGLYNRRGFFTLAEHQLKVADRQKKGLFLIYADLDHLKKINDKFGHNEGSRALIETAKILKKHFRKSDIMARLGGDEFAIIPVVSTGQHPDMIGKRLKEHLKFYNAKQNRGYKLSISIGVASYDPEKPCTIEELLSRADKLMYKHKKIKSKKRA